MIPFVPDYLVLGIAIGFAGCLAVALLWPKAFGLIRSKTDPAIQRVHDEVSERVGKDKD